MPHTLTHAAPRLSCLKLLHCKFNLDQCWCGITAPGEDLGREGRLVSKEIEEDVEKTQVESERLRGEN